jgi:hypothetical protein
VEASMRRTTALLAVLASAALFIILPASNLSAAPQTNVVYTTSGAYINPEVQGHLDQGDALAAEGRYGAARREYRAAAELMRAEGKLPAKAERRIANSFYYEDRYQMAGRTLLQLADEASQYGDLATQVWALADAAWIAGIAGDKIDMERRLVRLHRLLDSPYLPLDVRQEVFQKRLASADFGAKLAFTIYDP